MKTRIFQSIGYSLLSVLVYFLLQIFGSFVEFGIFGSGASIGEYQIIVPLSMVILQLCLIIYLWFKSSFFKHWLSFALALLAPIILFLFYYFVEI